jgi:N-acetylglucosaminyldiphosphoundecaprenol N-acetyl-beta-D-mannosaminyltransferase
VSIEPTRRSFDAVANESGPSNSADLDRGADRGNVFWQACDRYADNVLVPEARNGEHERMTDPVVTVRVAGMVLHPLTVPQIVNEIILRSVTGDRMLLANHNLHSLFLLQRHEDIRSFYARAERTIIDGAPILRMAQRKRADLTSAHRVGSTDWLGALLHVGNESGLRIALLGGAAGVAERAKEEIEARFTGITLSARDGFFDTSRRSAENQAVLAWIEDFRPDVLLVGMGMPRQESWVHENYDDIAATVTCTVGGCLDYIGGAQDLAPRWLGKYGLEWLYRLARDPRRLWRRYVVEPPMVATELFKRRFSRLST